MKPDVSPFNDVETDPPIQSSEAAKLPIPRQARLFPPDRPLLDRLGRDFFKNLPTGPGVYWMKDAKEKHLYIGQSSNLKKRLASYNYITPETHGKKLFRMTLRTRSIGWQTCDTHLEAQLTENRLLRKYKPTFNTLNTRPEHYAYIGMVDENERLQVRITKSARAREGESLYGAYKGIYRTRKAFTSLARALWFCCHPKATSSDLPSCLHPQRRADRFDLGNPGKGEGLPMECRPFIHLYLSGVSDLLIAYIKIRIQPQSCFDRTWFDSDADILQSFFDSSATRLRHLKTRHGLGSSLIQAEDLDDLRILHSTCPRERHAS